MRSNVRILQRSVVFMRSDIGILQGSGVIIWSDVRILQGSRVIMRRNGGTLQRFGGIRNGRSLQRSGVIMKRGILATLGQGTETAACQAWLRSEERPQGAGAGGGDGVHVEHQPLLGHQLYPFVHALLALCE